MTQTYYPFTGVPGPPGREPLVSFFTAASAAWNPIFECVPSQNGLFTDVPHRHKENAGLPVKSTGVPSGFNNSMLPSGASTRYGPFGLHVIFTWAIPSSKDLPTQSKSPNRIHAFCTIF
jgi:hypothetical protein